MDEGTTPSKSQDDIESWTAVMVKAYRHDVHKFTGHPHEYASDTFGGVRVNEPVPHGADGDAAALSRPRSQPTQTVDNHETSYRLSLATGTTHFDPDTFSRAEVEEAVQALLTSDDPEVLHRAWLDSCVAAAFNESVYYPYTSLKYHTLLVGALLDNYRAGIDFEDLRLVVDAANEIVPYRTIYMDDRFALRLDVDADGCPSARLGSTPWRSWASTWTRLTDHPLATNTDDYDRMLDANLRRIAAWSTALQYLEDFQREITP